MHSNKPTVATKETAWTLNYSIAREHQEGRQPGNSGVKCLSSSSNGLSSFNNTYKDLKNNSY